MRAWGIALSTLLYVLGHCSAVLAQEVDAERERRARLHYESGTAYFDTGDYESALREFRASYAESPHAELLYNVFLCEERIGNLAAAVEALEAFLATPEVPRRDVLERRLAHLRERAARGETRIEASEVERATPLQVDEATEGPAPSETASPSVERTPSQPAPEPPVLAIVGFAIAGAGLIGFGVGGAITLAEDARLRGCAPSCDDTEVQTIVASALAADISVGVALAGAVLGVVGLVMESSRGARSDASVRMRGLGLEARF